MGWRGEPPAAILDDAQTTTKPQDLISRQQAPGSEKVWVSWAGSSPVVLQS